MKAQKKWQSPHPKSQAAVIVHQGAKKQAVIQSRPPHLSIRCNLSHLSKPIQRPYRREQSHGVWLGIFCVKISYLFTVLVGNLEAKLILSG